MRIIGGKDYYDHGLMYGIDPDTVFVRTGFVLPAKHPLPAVYGLSGPDIQIRPEAKDCTPRSFWSGRGQLRWQHAGLEYSIEGVAVLFCDRYYSGIRVYWRATGPSWDLEKSGGSAAKRGAVDFRQETFWSRNSLAKFLAKRGATVLPAKRGKFGERVKQVFVARTLSHEELQGMVSNGVAVATHGPEDVYPAKGGKEQSGWLCNAATLKEYDFIKVVDPTQAFQQLSMWVGGVLPRAANPMVQITDDSVKLAKHGMDKWSFRKPGRKGL